MGAPKNEIMQMEYQNPDASMPLFIPVLVICNTPDEELERNIRANAAKPLEWLKSHPPHDEVAVMVGGGPSAKDDIDTIKHLKSQGAKIFAMNAASGWLSNKGVDVDYQCIIDAKEETSALIDYKAKCHLFGSQVHPKTMDSVESPVVWHLEIGEIEQYFPEDRKKKGGYVLLGGGASVGNSALCAAYALGYREIHIFGYDSSYRNDDSHAYEQPMNRFIPTIETEWNGKKYKVSVAMKAQAEKFQLTSRSLIEMGCNLLVHGEGLLQDMFFTDYHSLTEQQKYQYMWQFDIYRQCSPGERVVDFFIETFKPEGMVIDFGCGTGRAALRMREKGLNVFLIDFADNCRDEEAQSLPFIQWDLTSPIPQSAEYGFCTDVMEHIPPEDVEFVIKNIMNAATHVFFQISTVDDDMGEAIGEPLHLTVKNHSWWKELFNCRGHSILWEEEQEMASLFYVRR